MNHQIQADKLGVVDIHRKFITSGMDKRSWRQEKSQTGKTYVDFSVRIIIKNSISLEQNNFYLEHIAFASPPDLASSGVWENIVL